MRVRNAILSRIPDSEYKLLLPHLEFVETENYEVLHEPGDELRYTYFPNRGMVCIVAEISEGRTLEVGVVTRAGYAGESITVGQNWCPYRLIAQPAIQGFRVKADAMLAILPETPELHLQLVRYMKFQSLRTAQIAVCNRFHEIEQRLARWLLMSQERLGAVSLPFTHEFLASMLGTGRANITIAAGALQHAGMIRYHRGAVKVVNRKKLEGAACECYQDIKRIEAASGVKEC